MMTSATVRLSSARLESPHRTIRNTATKRAITKMDEVIVTGNRGHFKQELKRK